MSQRPIFSILHTSARPEQWRKIFASWLNTADHPDSVEYVLVADRRWDFDESMELSTRPQDKLVWNSGRKCYVEGVNLAAQHATGQILIVNADDQFPCEHWDTEILKTLDVATPFGNLAARAGAEHPEQFMLQVATGTPNEAERGIIVLPILSRALYEKWGYVMYPGYESMYSDNDLFEHATQEGVIIDARHLMFPHKHPLFTPGVDWDAAYAAQNRKPAYEFGRMLLEIRRADRFGETLSPQLVEMPGKKTVAVMTPGEWFHSSFLGNWTGLLSVLEQKFQVHHVCGYSSVVHCTRGSMAEHIGQIKPDFVLWMDDDQVLTAEQFTRLYRDLEENPEIDGVIGWAWCQQDMSPETEPATSALGPSDGKPHRYTYAELMAGAPLKAIKTSGMPACLFRGKVHEVLGAKAFRPIPDENERFGFLEEDAAFFTRANEAGLRIVVDSRVNVVHMKLGCAGPVQLPEVKVENVA